MCELQFLVNEKYVIWISALILLYFFVKYEKMMKIFKSERNVFVFSCIFGSLAFLIGFTVDRLVDLKGVNIFVSLQKTKRDFDPCKTVWQDKDNEYSTVHDLAYGMVDAQNIGNVLKYLTLEPHLAGSQRNNELGDYIAKTWEDFGMKVHKKTYEVLLSVPQKPAVLQLLNKDGTIDFEPRMVEDAFFKEESNSNSAPPFHAFSGHGDIKAELVNVNYGREEDYDVLHQNKINLKGKIHMSKLDTGWRGDKVRLAEENGAVGLLLYTEPKDGRDLGTKGYPKTWGLPPTAMRRGGLLNTKGDPLTQGWPAKPGMYRYNQSSIPLLPNIPVQPISDQIAEHLLNKMEGPIAPSHWIGSFNITYRFNTERKMRLKVDTHNVRKNITNTFGVLRGDTEPDRLVIIGNHRDAWVFGAGDASSGTACMMEVARVISKLNATHNDWKPRRTIVFASWDAEEYGLSGSMEWLEDYKTVMQAKTVAYINVDIAVTGNHSICIHATPSLSKSIFNVAKKLNDPDRSANNHQSYANLYDLLNARLPSLDFNNEPVVNTLSTGSDYTGFYAMFGIPAVDFRYEFDKKKYPTFGTYPTYHTIYDNYNYVTTFIDPDMRYHKSVTEMLLGQLLTLADDVILPLNLTRYAEKIEVDWNVFKYELGELFANQSISLAGLERTIGDLKNATIQFDERLKKTLKEDIHQVRLINDQMMWFERAFIVSEGIRKVYGKRHIIFSTGREALFSRNSFPSLSETLYDILIRKTHGWDELRKQISILINCIENAINIISVDGM